MAEVKVRIGRVALASFFAALVIGLWWWGIFWWGPLPYKAVDQVYDEVEIVRFLRVHLPESGTYMIPSPHDELAARAASLEAGPAVTLHVLAKEDIPSRRSIAVRGFIQAFLTMFILGYVMSRVRSALGTSYLSRVKFVVLTGLAALIYSGLVDPIWWYQPWLLNLVKALYELTSWILAGLILAKLIPDPTVVPDRARKISPSPASRSALLG